MRIFAFAKFISFHCYKARVVERGIIRTVDFPTDHPYK